ncbi:MAG TPA: anti-sigma factor [Acidimicrobiales bacterium]
MSTRDDHAEVEDLVGAYALDALEPAEREAVERHLVDCPRCRAEVAEHRETAALLAHTGAAAPPGVWDRIAAALEEPPPALRVPAPISLASRRPAAFRVVAAVAAVAAAAVVVLGVVVVDQGRRLDRVSLAEQALRAFTDPRAEHVVLSSPDGAAATTVAVMPDGTGFVVHDDLPALPGDATYQLWALVGDEQVSAGVLGRDPGVSEFRVDGPFDGFAVTRERAGGADEPTLPPVVVGFGEDA